MKKIELSVLRNYGNFYKKEKSILTINKFDEYKN